MKGITKILMFSLLFFACRGDGEVLNTAELKQEFENYWWEAVDKSLTDSFSLDELTCFNFDSTADVNPPNDGKVYYYSDGDLWSLVLSSFERVEEGYYLPEYDVVVQILADDEGIYTAKVKVGLFSQKSEIIPCSLGV
jgi:hypothetical protein